jgi:hypothetical protein
MKVGTYHKHMGRNCLRFEGLQPAVGEWVLARRSDGALVGEIVITGKAPSANVWWFRREVEEGYTQPHMVAPLDVRTKE